MTNKNNKLFIIGSVVVVIALTFGIYIMTKENKPIAKEDNGKEIVKEIEKEDNFNIEDIEKQAQKMLDNIKRDEEIEEKENVPAPEVREEIDEDGNEINVTDIPKNNPDSSPDGMKKPSEPTKKPTEPPKEKPKEDNNSNLIPDSENPFLNNKAPDQPPNESNSEDIGDGKYKPGQGDKF